MNINVTIDLIGLLIMGVIIAAERKRMKREQVVIRQLHGMMLCTIVVFASDIPGMLLDGKDFVGARPLLWCLDTVYWIPHAIYGWLWLLFVDFYLFRSADHLRRRRLWYAIPMAVELLLIAGNPFTGWIFTLDEANVYQKGSAYLGCLLPFVCEICMALLLVLAGGLEKQNAEQRRRCLSLLAFMFLPVCGVILEMYAYGVTWVWPFLALSLLMVYMNVQQQNILEERLRAIKEKERSARLENELINSRIKIMLSQIQPHFLYNSLSVIQALCETAPPTAAKAMEQFVEFLRGNMESLTMERLIPFSQELEHTQCYLALEQLRFGDTIRIEYHIEATLFRLPTLSLQPIVENAVRYGITKREEGGTVRIATCETPDDFCITVTDDGMGFDPMLPKSDGRTHIGITNVRNRLQNMCGGTLELQSTYGVGTKAVIRIPKGWVKTDES